MARDLTEELIDDLRKADEAALGELAAESKYLSGLIKDLQHLQEADLENPDVKKILKHISKLRNFLGRTEVKEANAWRRVDSILGKMDHLSFGNRGLKEEIREYKQKLFALESKLLAKMSRFAGGLWDHLEGIDSNRAVFLQLRKKGYDTNRIETNLKNLIRESLATLKDLETWVNGAIGLIQRIQEFAQN